MNGLKSSSLKISYLLETCVTADEIYVFNKSVMNTSTTASRQLKLSAFFAVVEVTDEPAAGFGEFGALPPKLDRETVRGTVSKNPRHDVVVPSAQLLMGIIIAGFETPISPEESPVTFQTKKSPKVLKTAALGDFCFVIRIQL